MLIIDYLVSIKHNGVVGGWMEGAALFDNSRTFLRQLMKAQRDLQTVSLLSCGLGSLQELQRRPLPWRDG